MNLLGHRYFSFCAASSVGIRDANLRFQPETAWTSEDKLKVTDVIHGIARDEDGRVFSGWQQCLLQSALRCAESHAGENDTCLEAEIRKVGVLSAEYGRAFVGQRMG